MPRPLARPRDGLGREEGNDQQDQPEQRHDVEPHEAVDAVERVAVVVLVDDQAVVDVVDGGEPARGDRSGLDEHAQGDQPGQRRGRSASRSFLRESPWRTAGLVAAGRVTPDVVHPGRARRQVYPRALGRPREGRPGAPALHRSTNSKGIPSMRIPLSILDLAPIGRGETASEQHRRQRRPRPARRGARLPRGSGTPSTTTCRSIASSATSVLIAHVAAHTSTIRLGAGGIMLPNHSPLDDRRAVRHARRAAPRPHRPRPRAGRPARDQNTMRALRRDPTSADTLPPGRARAAGLPRPARPASRASTRSRARARNVPLYILGSSLFGASWPPRSGCPTRSPRTSRPQALRAGRRRLPARVPAVRRSSTGPYVIAGVNVIAADTDAPTPRSSSQASRRARAARCSAAGSAAHRRGGRRMLARPGRRAARRPDDDLRRRRHAGRGRRLPRRVREARRRRRADRRPPGAHDRGPAALGRAARRGDGDGPRPRR